MKHVPESLASLVAQPFPPVQYLVNGMIARGNLAVLGGRPKSGKSWFALQCAMSVDTGNDFLGKKTTKVPVLYIALEDGRRRIHQRCNTLGWKPSKEAAVLFDIGKFDPTGSKTTPGVGVQEIENFAQTYDFIVIDTLIKALSPRANENDNVTMGAIGNVLARIAHDTDTAIFIVHHTGKGNVIDPFDLLRGASAIRGAYDVGFILERKQDEKEATLHAESRDLDIEGMTIRQAANGAGWSYEGNKYEIVKIRAGRKVVKALKEHGDGQTADGLAEILGISAQAARKQLNAAEGYGYVRREQEVDTGGKPADVWYLDVYNPDV